MHTAGHIGLSDLYHDVARARAALERVRATAPQTQVVATEARSDLVLALEAYARGLESVNCPVPYKLRDELRLHRRLAGNR